MSTISATVNGTTITLTLGESLAEMLDAIESPEDRLRLENELIRPRLVELERTLRLFTLTGETIWEHLNPEEAKEAHKASEAMWKDFSNK
jgi:hypothetical protein